ncbi:MAG: hypothetical protein KGD63_10040 [Candidatus Lokiarchaeota archaeon]|nr:hypothetical protein [Candidatus Lokiarchaeota archaeon]
MSGDEITYTFSKDIDINDIRAKIYEEFEENGYYPIEIRFVGEIEIEQDNENGEKIPDKVKEVDGEYFRFFSTNNKVLDYIRDTWGRRVPTGIAHVGFVKDDYLCNDWHYYCYGIFYPLD